MENCRPVLALFAGPGGLAEGISTFIAPDEVGPFDLTLSVEKENSAWRTLRLRAFTRQFKDELPSEYYQYIAGKLGNSPEEELFKKYPRQAEQANKEVLQCTLDDDCNLIQDQILTISLSVRNNTVFPKERHRVIVLGVKDDIKKEPEILKSKERLAFKPVFHGD